MNVSKKIRVLAALGTLSGAVWAGTFATFTDEAEAGSTFSTGSVDLVLAGDDSDAYDFVSLSTDNMRPGDVTFAPLVVENTGTLPFTYAMTSAETEAVLSGALTLGAVVNAATCDSSGYATAAGTGANVVVPSGALSAAAITSRSLAAEASETLCVRVELPSTAGNTLQDRSTTSTFTFVATQS